MTFSVLHRPAESQGAFERVATSATLGVALDEVASWRGPHLRHGDLVRVVCASTRTDRLFVYDDARGAAVAVARAGWAPPWAEAWGGGLEAPQMARACGAVSRRRLALAAAACAKPHALSTRAAAALAAAVRWADDGSAPRVAQEEPGPLWEAGVLNGRGERRLAYGAIAAHYVTSICASTGRGASADFYQVMAHLPRNDDARAAAEIRRWVPLPVVACARVGARDPLPLPAR